jgi:hypothetical protein
MAIQTLGEFNIGRIDVSGNEVEPIGIPSVSSEYVQ